MSFGASMVVRRVTKYLSVSLVSGGLMLGFASVAHAQTSVVVDNQSGSLVQNDNTPSDDSGQSNSQTKSQNISNTTIEIDSTTSQSQIVQNSDADFNANGSTLESKDGSGTHNKDHVKSLSEASITTGDGGVEKNDVNGLNAKAKADEQAGSSPVVAPNIQSSLISQQSLPLNQAATFSHTSKNRIVLALANNAPSETPPAAPVVPHKDLPIQGALAGLNDVLANITMPLRGLSAILLAGAHESYPVGLIVFVASIVVAGLVIAGRFVDMLRASGYSNAARADALDAIYSFATQFKVSYVLAYVPRYQLAFFGVRNKVFNVPNLTKEGGECK
jgi:hypothetical protein